MLIPLVSLARRLVPRTFVPDIAIHGRHSPNWHSAFAPDAAIWAPLNGIAQGAVGPARWWRKRVVVPLMEPHVASMPGGCHALVPEPGALAILADKARFAQHAAAIGAAHLLPKRIDPERPTFPAVLKRTDLNAGNGVALATSPEQLEERLAEAPWAGHRVLLQEAIPARTDFVTHIVSVRGRIVWHCTYAYPLANRRVIRGPVEALTIERRRTRLEDIRAFEQLLAPLAFDGPANIDYRRRRDGSLAILEINPRLGGSLMRPENAPDLAGCLRAIVRYARWRPARAGAHTGYEVRA